MTSKLIIFLIAMQIFYSCNTTNKTEQNYTQEINQLMDKWHRMAADADISYFDYIADNGIYIGTAKEEVWTKKEFLSFSKPYFDNGKAWDFKPFDRNIYLNDNMDFAWFNEKLETWMGTCRGSGVLQKTKSGWKIYQYTLSVAVPNEKINEVISVINKE